MDKNIEIKRLMKCLGVYQYKVAEVLGICEMTLIRWLRKPLTHEKQVLVIKAIHLAAKERDSLDALSTDADSAGSGKGIEGTGFKDEADSSGLTTVDQTRGDPLRIHRASGPSGYE